MEKLVAIVGTGRNGSTLLGRLLDGSPDLWMHPLDLCYLSAWDDLARTGHVSAATFQNRTTRRLRALDGALPATRLLEIYAPQWAEIERDYVNHLVEQIPLGDPATALEERERWSAPEFLPAFLDATRMSFGDSGEERLLAFKTIETPYVDDYARAFPQMRFVHIIRDPVTTYASLKRTRMQQKHLPFYADGDHLRTFLEARWLPHAAAIARGVEQEPARHLLVRYEDLTADARGTIGMVCEWLGIAMPREPDRQTALGGRHLTELVSNSSAPGVPTPEHVVADMSGRFAYDDVLTARERALVEHATALTASHFGYAKKPGPAARVWLSWLIPDADERLNRRSRLRWSIEVARRRMFITQLLLMHARSHR